MPVPLGMRTGDWPSGPPSRGRMVVLVATRTLMGSWGYRRTAVGVRCREWKGREVGGEGRRTLV